MSLKTPTPRLSAQQMEDLAREMGSNVLMRAAEEQRLKEQRMIQHRIGSVTMKIIDGEYYQLRPHGWIKVSSLSDIIFEDVRPLPVNERVKSYYPCRLDTEGESHQFNVGFPIRTDLTQLVTDERVALGIAKAFNVDEAVVHIGHRDKNTVFRVIGQENVVKLKDESYGDVGGPKTIDLEV